ncbi:MAG: Ig-like domain-containing protein [Thermodesulfobacteriota bacterium]
MQFNRFIFIPVLLVLLAFFSTGCNSSSGGSSNDNGEAASTVSDISVSASPTSLSSGEQAEVTAVVKDQNGDAMEGETVRFDLTANNSGSSLDETSADTNADGRASLSFTAGETTDVSDTITAAISELEDTVSITVLAESAGDVSPAALFTGGATQIKGEGFFTSVSYVGAFDPGTSATWAEGWTIAHGETSEQAGIWDDSRIDTSAFGQATVGGLAVTDNGDGSVTIEGGTMTEDATFTNDRVWKLAGSVIVGDKENLPGEGESLTLTIEPGTKIVGLTDLPSGIIPRLAISRGHKIQAEGTAEAPILMTSSKAQGASEWGGLAISGLAPVNVTGGTALGEGDTGIYGGDDPEDDSGVLRYVVVAHAGYKFTEEDELNGIAFQGVGSGTTVDHIQVHRNADDGVEFYGGTVNARYIYLTENQDDSLDWTSGWQGKVQFVSIHKNPNSGDQGIEADNLKADKNATPRSHPVLANMTIRGYENNGKGILLRRGTAANIYNTIVTGFGEGQIDIDDLATFQNAVDPAWPTLSGELTMENSLVWGDKLFEDMEEAEEPWDVSDWYDNQNNFEPQDPVLNADGTLSQ